MRRDLKRKPATDGATFPRSTVREQKMSSKKKGQVSFLE